MINYIKLLDSFLSYKNFGKDSFTKIDYIKTNDENNYTIDEVELLTNEFRLCEDFVKLVKVLSEEMLIEYNNTIKVKINKYLDWKRLSFLCGEDLFSCCFLANKRYITAIKFDWEYSLQTNDTYLDYILYKGVSENHFHIKNSASISRINWNIVTNELFHNDKLFSKQQESLFRKIRCDKSFEELQLLSYRGCILRFYLYNVIRDIKYEAKGIFIRKYMSSNNLSLYKKVVKLLKPYSSAIDYACSSSKNDDYCSGERFILYNIFLMYNNLSSCTKLLFIDYLRVKDEFMSYFVQNNDIYGFNNFSTFDRFKEFFIDVSIKSKNVIFKNAYDFSMQCKNIKSIEFRVAPRKKKIEYKQHLERMKKQIGKSKYIAYDGKQNNYYVVYHFIKEKDGFDTMFYSFDKETRGKVLYSRNYKVRRLWKMQAIALKKYTLSVDDPNKTLIRGIDCANTEIGCRPEVAAQLYRYLRNIDYMITNPICGKKINQISNKFTYHVGEDAYDLADGIRAIFEAIIFLEMKNGDRLGHCSCLGFDIEEYYKIKNYRIIIPKQVLLDNYAWLYYICRENNYGNSIYLLHILGEIKHLVKDIYHENLDDVSFEDYLQSIFLRGNNPDIFFSRKKIWSEYDLFYKSNSVLEIMDRALENDNAIEFFYKYHYFTFVREKGNTPTEVKIDMNYIEMVSFASNYVKRLIKEKGLCIESNPSSNYLISPIEDYKNIPLLGINKCAINCNDNIPICINTDGQGIFSTSLDNEYALVLCILRNDKDNNYSDEEIYKYLDYLREIGNAFSFK